MTDETTRDEERDDLDLDKETIADLDAADEGTDVKGGASGTQSTSDPDRF